MRCISLLLSFFGIWLAAGLGGGIAHADDRIWTALILATNVADPKPATGDLAQFSDKIEKFFGYNQVELVGSATKTIDEKVERWLVPSQDFWVCAKSRKIGDSRYVLDVQMYHDKRRLVQAQAKVAPGSPLFIRGPLHARGQLVMVVQILPRGAGEPDTDGNQPANVGK